ncbi:sulfite exporter TauE/SafE family protein [Patescibacteria group bacterium]|nr:sulfite exporter TauE/SafE family protein [Patescibacteria group bacterium]
MPKHKFFISGIHCKSCKIIVENILSEDKDVKMISVNMKSEDVIIETDRTESLEEMGEHWSEILKEYGYKLSSEREKDKKGKIYTAFAIGISVLTLFFYLQKSGFLNLGLGEEFNLWTALFLGVIASLSSCLAIVGGLLLSLSAKVSQDINFLKPIYSFHIGRLFGFLFFGGLLGIIGSAVAVSHEISAILGLLAALVMIILGINLLGIFRSLKQFQITLPRYAFEHLKKIENGALAPLLVGAGTFFLPCGFTQSMQIMALSSGSVVQGSLIMTVFALGTLPVLALVSFGSFKFAHSKNASLFFKTAGVVVIGLGIFALLSGLASLGIIKPLFNI